MYIYIYIALGSRPIVSVYIYIYIHIYIYIYIYIFMGSAYAAAVFVLCIGFHDTWYLEWCLKVSRNMKVGGWQLMPVHVFELFFFDFN